MSDKCKICPRSCGTDRDERLGFCQSTNKIRVARAALHHWEEPCISGERGSGTVFFCGCNLKCVFCQNFDVSRNKIGVEISADKLAEIFIKLQNSGAHNINLVTPTHYVRQIAEALELAKPKLSIPVVYNCGGYESAAGLDIISKYIDVYLVDMKYSSNALAQKYSGAPDYAEIALDAIEYMINNAGEPSFDGDMLNGGVIVRHLILPSHRHDSMDVLSRLKERFGTDKFILSLMSQYTPAGNLENFPEIDRRLTSFEYNSVEEKALELGFTNAYVQERGSASSEYIPPFDLSGLE